MYQADSAAADGKAVKILENLIDDYYICLGQLEALPAEPVKAELGQPEKEIETVPEVGVEPIAVAPTNVTIARPAISKAIAPDLMEPQARVPLEAIMTNSDLANSEVSLVSSASSANDQADMTPSVSEDDMWNCEFGDPVGPKLTDADLYED